MIKRCKILLVDKKNKYYTSFNGLRKNKFEVQTISSVLKCTDSTLQETSVFFVILYEPKDIIQIVRLTSISKTIIIGTVNKRLFNSLRNLKDYPIVDLSLSMSLLIPFQEALDRFY
jgi:hypothetical protein